MYFMFIAETVMLKRFGDSSAISISTLMGSCFIINVILSTTMQELWGSLKVFQAITHLTLIGLPIPSNCQ